jgi:hypothetical protein
MSVETSEAMALSAAAVGRLAGTARALKGMAGEMEGAGR